MWCIFSCWNRPYSGTGRRNFRSKTIVARYNTVTTARIVGPMDIDCFNTRHNTGAPRDYDLWIRKPFYGLTKGSCQVAREILYPFCFFSIHIRLLFLTIYACLYIHNLYTFMYVYTHIYIYIFTPTPFARVAASRLHTADNNNRDSNLCITRTLHGTCIGLSLSPIVI